MKCINKKGLSLIEILIVMAFIGVIVLIAIYFTQGYMKNSKRDTMVESAYFFIDMVRNQLTSENALPDMEKALIVSYDNFKDNLKKGGKSPFDRQEYKNETTYVAVINKNGTMHFYVAMEDQSKNCLVMLTEADVKEGSKRLRKYVRSKDACKITPIQSQQSISTLIYKGGDEENIEYEFSIY